MIDFRNMNIIELETMLLNIGEKKFRAKQVFKWIQSGVEDFEEMTDLSKCLREKLKNLGYLCNMEVKEKLLSKLDGTTKYLMHLKDSNLIECVVMKYDYGNTICISTQAGCNMGCTFCASAIGGKKRDLTAGEMIGQILIAQKDSNVKISNIVLMGTGEPFDNFKNVTDFINMVNNKDGLNIGMRHITISTCGLIPEIIKFADMNLQITLAISLHAPNDEIRIKTMPVTKKYSIQELLKACRYYIDKTNRRITFEYALIDGLNDQDESARELASKLRGMLCHVNLIPVNKVSEKNYEKSNKIRIESFKKILTENGIETTVRRELGSDIDAACGQLRRKYLDE
jgi:23S rRNA (adenine2503-C2)-methyltransferase